ncbi:MAG: caspase family protein [Polyangia bacterium]
MASQSLSPELARSLRLLPSLPLLAVVAALLGLGARPASAQAPPPTSMATVPSMTQELLDRATLRIEPGRHTAAITRIATAGGRVVTASEDRTVRIWDGATGELVRTLRPPSAAEGEEGRLYALALSPDGRLIAAAGATRFADDAEQRTASVYLFDAGTGELVRRLPGAPFAGALHRIERVAFSPDGRRLAAIRVGHNTAGVYDVATGVAITAPTGEPSGAGFGIGQYIDADFDGAGRLLLGQQDGHLTLYDAGLKRLVRLEALGRILRARFAPDGKRVAVLYEDGRLELRRAADLKPMATLDTGQRGATVPVLGWAPDGQSLWTAAWVGSPPATVLRRFSAGARRPAPAPPPTERPLPGPLLTDLVVLEQAILFGASDGSWGRISPDIPDGPAAADDTVQRFGTGAAASAAPESLWVDTTGEEIELRLGPLARERLRFSVPALELKPTAGEAPGLRPPHLEPPVPHRITGWMHQGMVLFDDAAVTARGEDPAALAIAPSREAFALGTAARLLAFRFRRAADDGCPVRSPAGLAYLPCWSRPVPAPVRALNHSGDGRYVVALLADGTVRWYGAADGRERLILVAVPGDPRWLLVRPDGLYAASPGGAAGAGWQVNRPATATGEPGADFFPLLQLQRSHERPATLARTLAEAGPPPPRPRLRREELPSLVTILDPLDGARASGGTVTLRLAVRSPAGQPATLRVKLDGRPVPSGAPDGPSPATAQARGVLGLGQSEPPPRALPLPPGTQLVTLTVAVPARDCVLAVYAEGAEGTASGPPALVRLRGPASTAPSARPTLRVLAIGVGNYQRPALRLRYPAKDAADLVKLIVQKQGTLYHTVETRLVTDRDATRARILAGLDWLRQQAGAADTTLLFLAGHGINEPATGEYFFLPVDADPGSAAQSMLPASALRELLASLPGRVVLLLDTCHSGSVLGRGAGGLAAPSPTALARERAISDLASVEGGVVVMTAATGSQASIEDAAWQNGAFTRALLEGLAGRADLRRTGRVTVNMLDLYVSERVRELTAGTQTPATAKPSTIPDFPLVLSR